MPSSTFYLFATVAAVSSVIYAFFSGKSDHDDPTTAQQPPQQPPHGHSAPSTSTSHHPHSYYHSQSLRSAPSSSTHSHPSYQQPPIEPRTAQAAVNTKEDLEYSRYAYLYGLASSSSSRTVPTSATQAQIPHPTQSTASRVPRTTSTTSGHLDPLHRTAITSSDAWDSPLTPSTSTLTHTSYAQAAQQTSARGAQTTARSPTRTDFASSSSVWESFQTSPTRSHASYSAQQTSARLDQTTSRTPTGTDFDSSLHRSDFASPFVWESRQTSSTPTRTHSTRQTSAGVGRSTVRVSTIADYDDDDDMGPSPYSYLRTPSPDAPRARPQKHSRKLSSSSDSDYPGPSSRTQAVPRSQSHSVHAAIADTEDREKAMKLRDQARRSARDMREARDRAKRAQKIGDRDAEREYRQEARAHESAKKNLDNRAAKIFLKVNNKAHKEGTVDFHGLYVAEAVEYAKEELQSAIYRDDDTVRFIVGQGRHSEDGVSKLRPALEALFDERRLRYSLDPGNAGKLIVYLDR